MTYIVSVCDLSRFELMSIEVLFKNPGRREKRRRRGANSVRDESYSSPRIVN